VLKTRTTLLVLTATLVMCFLLPSELAGQVIKVKGQGPPPWAPAHGYRAKTRHIYFPDLNIYFNLRKGVYIYLSAGIWKVSAGLPKSMKGTNLKTSVQIELDLDIDNPHKFNADHKTKYKVKIKTTGQPVKSSPGHGKGK